MTATRATSRKEMSLPSKTALIRKQKCTDRFDVPSNIASGLQRKHTNKQGARGAMDGASVRTSCREFAVGEKVGARAPPPKECLSVMYEMRQ